MSNEHNLLYKPWSASLRRKMGKKNENKKNVHMYTLLTQAKTVTCYMTHQTSFQGECPTTNKTATVLTTTKI
jgi:hypothetical protein